MRPKCRLTFDQASGNARDIPGDPNPVGIFTLLSPVFEHKGQQIWGERPARAEAALEARES